MPLRSATADPAPDDPANLPPRHRRLALPGGVDPGESETLVLGPGAHVRRVTHAFAPAADGALRAVATVEAALPEPVLLVQVLRQGQGVLHDRHLGQRWPYSPAVGVFAHLDAIRHRHLAVTAGPLEATVLSLSETALRGYLGEPLARDLLRGLGLGAGPAACARPLPARLRAVLQASLAGPPAAPLRTLHAEAKVLEFLVGLADGCALAPPREHRRALPTEALQALRWELARLDGPAPDLAALAARYGLTPRTLSAHFQQAFGQSLPAYLRDLRLDAARQAVLAGEEPLKSIAARLGFASVQHFSNAFLQRFGERPGRGRRQGHC